MKRLIVTADDFGAAPEVNEAVETAHRHGILTAASLMVSGPAVADAIARARRLPSLRVGLHVVLVEGTPVLPAGAVSELLDADGRLRSDLAAFGAAIACSSRVRRQLAAEIRAQFAAFRDSGLTLDHCNAHKHFHLHPFVGGLLVEIGRTFALPAMRVPLEPTRLLRKVEPRTPWTSAPLLAPFILSLRRRLRAAGVLVPDRVFGLRWSGEMTRERLAGLIRNLPPRGLTEIYLHPATQAYDGGAAGYRYREEYDALRAPEVVALCRDATLLRLGGFRDFANAATGAAATDAAQERGLAHRA